MSNNDLFKEGNIPSGYMITVTSWENDADNYRTEALSGIKTKEDVAFFLDFLDHFKKIKPDYAADEAYELGNDFLEDEAIYSLLEALESRHPNVSNDVRQEWLEYYDPQYIEAASTEQFPQLLGHPVEDVYRYSTKHFCRLVESVQVYYIPEKISDISIDFKPVKKQTLSP